MCKRKLSAIASFLCLALSFSAHAISRVGNSRIGSQRSQFTAPIDPQFCSGRDCVATPTVERSLVIEVPGYLSGPEWEGQGFQIPIRVYAFEFGDKFPEFESLGREEFRRRMAGPVEQPSPWKPVQSQNPCIEVWSLDQNGTASVLASWGQGKGVVLVAPSREFLSQGMLRMIQQIELEPGACAWK